MRLPERLARVMRERWPAARGRLGPLGREPWIVLLPLVLIQWLAVGVFALSVQRNGWLFYQGGDETWFYTSAWALADGHVPEASVGWAWPYLLAPIAGVAGPSVVAALPGLVLFQFLVLLPLGLLAVYGIAARIGGRLLGYAAAVAWIAVPYLTIPLFVDRYYDKYVEQFLPQAFGMTGLGDFPSMIALLVAAYFVVRAIDTGAPLEAVAGGLAAGLAIGIKPANGLFLLGPLLGLALARRWQAGLAFATAVVPALVALAVWKQRGLGELPVFSLDPHVLAADATAPAPHPDQLSAYERMREYVPLDRNQLQSQFIGFQEFFWSVRLVEYLPLAGLLAVARVSVPKAALLGGWLGAFFLVKGSSPATNVESGSFFRLLMPAWPAYFLLTASIPLLVPQLGPSIAARFPVKRFRLDWRPVAAAALVLAVVPVVLFLALRPLETPTATKYFDQNVVIPVDRGFAVSAVAGENNATVTWERPAGSSADVFYRLLRSFPTQQAPDPTLPPGRNGIRCLGSGPGAADCRLEMTTVTVTRSRSFVDRPPPGTYTYRVGMAANWLNDPEFGDVLMVSRPVTITVG